MKEMLLHILRIKLHDKNGHELYSQYIEARQTYHLTRTTLRVKKIPRYTSNRLFSSPLS